MLRRVLVDEPGLRVAEVRCGGHGAGWAPPEPTDAPVIVLVRRGVFRRRVDGVESVADPVTGYLQRAGHEQQIAHPAGADVCTSIGLAKPGQELWPGDEWRGDRATWPARSPAAPILVSPATDLAHRRLLAAARRGADPVALADEAAALATSALSSLPGAEPALSPAHRRLVNQARESLHHEPDRRLTALAAELRVSPYHLSRVFHRVTGVTLGSYRARLRARRALDRLERGDGGLARIAAELGFADQAHLTRTLRGQTGLTPTRLRRLLRPEYQLPRPPPAIP